MIRDLQKLQTNLTTLGSVWVLKLCNKNFPSWPCSFYLCININSWKEHKKIKRRSFMKRTQKISKNIMVMVKIQVPCIIKAPCQE